MGNHSRLTLLLAVLIASSGLAACKEKPRPQRFAGPPARAVDRPQPKSPDRLPPGKLLEGEEELFGLMLPRQMHVDARFPKRGHALGAVELEQLGDYVQKRVLVRHVEMSEGRLTFPKVRIRGRDDEKVFQILLQDEGKQTRLLVRDITLPPVTEGITEEERWKRAGLRSDGSLLDPKSME